MSKLSQSGHVQMGVRIPADIAEEMKIHCIRKKVSLKDFLTEAALEKLAKEKAA